MSDNGPKALIVRPTTGLQQHGFGVEKVLSRIVSDALTIVRGREVADSSARIRIGKDEFREQDYQQILIWADATERTPEELVSLLAEVSSSFLVENGSIKRVAFPKFILKAEKENQPTKLDLSNVPALIALGCVENRLTELGLS